MMYRDKLIKDIKSGKKMATSDFHAAQNVLEAILYKKEFSVAEKILKQLDESNYIHPSEKYSWLVRAVLSIDESPWALPWLLKQGIPLHCTGYTPLIHMVQGGSLASIPILQEYGANLDEPDSHGLSSLTYVIREYSLGVADALLKAGARVVQMEPIDAVQSASFTKHQLRERKIDTPLLHVLMNAPNIQDVATVLEQLLTIAQVREKVNIVDKDGKSIIHYVASRHKSLIGLLKDNGVDLDQLDSTGNSPLTRLIYDSHLGLAEELLNQGAKVAVGRYRRIDDGVITEELLLNRLIQRGNKEGVERILPKLLSIKEVSESINAADKDGNTALHYAAQYLGVSSVKLLVNRGADIFKENGEGLKPSQTAKEFRHLKSNRYLEQVEHERSSREQEHVNDIDQLGKLAGSGPVFADLGGQPELETPFSPMLREQNRNNSVGQQQDNLLVFSNASVVLVMFLTAYVVNKFCNRRITRSFGLECSGKEKDDQAVREV